MYHIGYRLVIGTPSKVLRIHRVTPGQIVKAHGKITLDGSEYSLHGDSFYRHYFRLASRLWLAKGVLNMAFYEEGKPEPIHPFDEGPETPLGGDEISSWFRSTIFKEVFSPEPNWFFMIMGVAFGLAGGVILDQIIQRIH